MRLRYLHLAHYPPLADLAVHFSTCAPWAAFEGQEKSSSCSIHFVIGLNGSGKSLLLRSVAATFLALADERLPGFPVTLVYELGRPGTSAHKTVIFDSPGEKSAASLWVAEGWQFPDATEHDTFGLATSLLRAVGPSRAQFGGAVFEARISRGMYPQAAPYALPRAVLAYTSGSIAPWREIWLPPASGEGLDVVTQSEDYDSNRERPSGWTVEDEERATIGERIAGGPPLRTEPEAVAEDLFRRPILLEGVQLAGALLVVALHEAKRVWDGQPANEQLAELFRKAGWQQLVGVRLRLNLERALNAPRALLATLHDALLAAGEVIREPHPTEPQRSLCFDVEGLLAPAGVAFEDERLIALSTQGQALHALLGEEGDSAFERFGKLLSWSNYGLLENLELFIRRANKPEDEGVDSIEDAGLLRFSELSDGERQLLARWALFHLLAGQENALLLLDEPETHFNDAWKREIVGVIDGAMGRDASAVLLATHSAIVLSDVFDEEVVLIRKSNGQSTVGAVTDRTFATDPSALVMMVFGADDSIGRRAQLRIEAFMREAASKSDPTPDDVHQLEALIRRLGTGFYRTELQTLLNRWQQAPDLRATKDVTPTIVPDTLKNELRALILKAQQSRPVDTEGGDA